MNVANKLTLARVAMIPLFIVLYIVLGRGFIVGGLFIIASLTDMLDGYIARSKHLITTFGKFADPLADKLLVTGAMIMLTADGLLPGWAVMTILAREFIVTGFRVVAASEGITIAASPFGKIKTITQLLSLILLLMNVPLFDSIGMILFYIAVFFTVLSGVDYLIKNKQVLNLSDI